MQTHQMLSVFPFFWGADAHERRHGAGPEQVLELLPLSHFSFTIWETIDCIHLKKKKSPALLVSYLFIYLLLGKNSDFKNYQKLVHAMLCLEPGVEFSLGATDGFWLRHLPNVRMQCSAANCTYFD